VSDYDVRLEELCFDDEVALSEARVRGKWVMRLGAASKPTTGKSSIVSMAHVSAFEEIRGVAGSTVGSVS
jgi:hypothetical protein